MFGFFGRRKNRGEFHRVLPFKKVIDGKHVAMESEKLWKCVSISRSQFTDHYIGLSANVAMYMQDRESFGIALSEARNALQGTMLVRLPVDRPREQGAQVEQLWKFTMFACHMLRGASRLNRTWHKKNGDKLLFVDFAVKGLNYTDTESGNSNAILNNLNQLLSESSAQWLMEDDGKCIAQLNRAASGQKCFIDSIEAVGEKPNIKIALDDPIKGVFPKSEKAMPIAMVSVDSIERNRVATSDKKIANAGSITPSDTGIDLKDNGSVTAKSKKKKPKKNVLSKTTAPKPNKKIKTEDKAATLVVDCVKASKRKKNTTAKQSSAKQKTEPRSDDDVLQLQGEFALPKGNAAKGTDALTKIVALDTLTAALGMEVNDKAQSPDLCSDIGKAVINDETIPEGKETAEDHAVAVSVKDFIDWLDINAEWQISRCQRKTFMYQKMVHLYINSRGLDITLAEFGLRLESEGFERINENQAQLMVMPEVEENV